MQNRTKNVDVLFLTTKIKLLDATKKRLIFWRFFFQDVSQWHLPILFEILQGVIFEIIIIFIYILCLSREIVVVIFAHSDWLIFLHFYWLISDDHFCPACAYSSSSDDQLIAQLEFYFSQGRFSNISIDFELFDRKVHSFPTNSGFSSQRQGETSVPKKSSRNIFKPLKDNLIQDHYLRSQMDDEVSTGLRRVGFHGPSNGHPTGLSKIQDTLLVREIFAPFRSHAYRTVFEPFNFSPKARN